MALTTLTSVKAQAGIAASDTSRDSQIRVFIDGIASLVKQHLNRNLESASYTEFYSGNGTPFLMLNQYPVTAVTSVCVDNSGFFGGAPGGFNPSLNLIEGVDYAIMSGANGVGSTGMLRRIGSTWPANPTRTPGVLQNRPGISTGNIKVQYSAGFVVVPPAIAMAVNSAVIKQLSMAAIGGAASQMSYEDASVSFLPTTDAFKLFGSIESTLATFRSIPI